MNDVLKFGKKLFTFSVVAMTLAWSLGVSALVPVVAHAEGECPTLSAGDLVQLTGNSAVFLLNSNLERLYFPNSEVYHTWYSDFSGVNKLTQTCFNAYPQTSSAPYGVSFRPGSMLVKEEVNNTVYAVTPNGTKVALPSEEVASALYGSNWTTKVRDVNSAWWTTVYPTVGTALVSAVPHAGMLVKKASSDSVYFVKDGKLYMVDGTLGASAGSVQTVSDSVFATVEDSGSTVTKATVLDLLVNLGQGTTTTPPTASGNLAVSLNASTPTSATLPKSATNVDVLKVNLVAGSSAVTVNEVTVKRSGAGLTTGLTSYLYDGEVRLGSSGRTFSSDTNTAEFTSLGLVVPANSTKVLTVRLQTGTTAGEHNFSITAINSSLGTTVTGLPVTGNTFTVSSAVTAGTLTVVGTGTLSNPTVGDTNVTMAQFKLTAATEDEMFSAITLKQDGTLTTSNLSNFKLYQGVDVVPTTATLNGRYLTLALNTPLKLVNGASKTFSLVGDISASADVADTIVFFMNNAADVKAVGTSYGYGALATITSYDDAGNSSTLTLQGGGVTISNHSASAHDVKVDSTSVELMRVAVKAVSDSTEVQKMTLQLETTSTTNSAVSYGLYKDLGTGDQYDSTTDTLLIRNIKLIDADSGQTIGSAKAITDADSWADGNNTNATLTFTYTDYFTVAKGATKNVAVVADINTAQVSGVVYKATLEFGSTVFTAKDSKDNTITDVVPATNVAGYNVTTRSSSLTVSRAASPESRTVVKGSTVDALGMIFTAGSGAGNDVKVSALTLNTYINASTTADVYYTLNTETETVATPANAVVTQVSLYVGDTLVAGPATVDSNGKAIFSSSKFVGGYYTIPAGTSKTIVAKAVISGNAPYGSENDAFAFTLATADITAEDANGSFDATVTGTNLNGTTAPSVAITVAANGTITTAANSGKPDAGIVLAGLSTEQEMHRITLTATKEAFNVQKMTILVSSTDAYDDVEYVQLYSSTGTQLGPDGGVGLNSSGQAVFDSLNFSVANTGETVVVVKAKFSAIGERTTNTVGTAGTGADSGDFVEFRLDTTADYFKAVATSGFTDTAADAAVGNTMSVRLSKPTVAVATLPSTSLSTGSNTGKTIMKFTVTAPANGDVVLGSIAPYIDFNDSDGTDAWLRITSGTLYAFDVTGSETQLNTDGYVTSTTSSTDGQFLINFDTTKVVTIAAGTTRTFEVRADIAGVEAGDSIDTYFVRDAGNLSAFTETFANAYGDANNDFVWSDQSADSDGVGSTEWVNGFYLSLPTSHFSVSKSS
ncbi:MAG: hypothetical protein WC025_00230 [Candidatus Magasanikbacteria bacterium]